MTEAEAMARATHVLTRSAELWKRWDDTATPWGSMTKAQWDAMQQFMVTQKLLPAPVDSDTLFSTALLDRVNAMDTAAIIQRARAA